MCKSYTDETNTDWLLVSRRNELFSCAGQESQNKLFTGYFRSLAERAEFRKRLLAIEMSDGRLAALIGMPSSKSRIASGPADVWRAMQVGNTIRNQVGKQV